MMTKVVPTTPPSLPDLEPYSPPPTPPNLPTLIRISPPPHPPSVRYRGRSSCPRYNLPPNATPHLLTNIHSSLLTNANTPPQPSNSRSTTSNSSSTKPPIVRAYACINYAHWRRLQDARRSYGFRPNSPRPPYDGPTGPNAESVAMTIIAAWESHFVTVMALAGVGGLIMEPKAAQVGAQAEAAAVARVAAQVDAAPGFVARARGRGRGVG